MTSRDLCLVLLLLPLYCNAVVHNTAKFKVWCGRKKVLLFFQSRKKMSSIRFPNQNGNDIYFTISILDPPREESTVHILLMRQD